MVENQADADGKTSMKDRLKMAGGDVIGGVADTVDNPVVSVVANVAMVGSYCLMYILPIIANRLLVLAFFSFYFST